MSSLMKASSKIQAKKQNGELNGKGKAKAVQDEQKEDEEGSTAAAGKPRKDKVLMLCSRGVTQRHRHLMRDLEVLLPHTKKGQLFSFPLFVGDIS